MGKKEIVWPSEQDKYEAIGFLARKGVIQNIEANVPTKFLDRFKERFKGKYTNNQPYDVGTKKGGEQYRITLNHLEGCPEFLKKQVDGKTKVRINATGFIRELIEDYGFIFSCCEQNGELIKSIVQEKGADEFKWFKSTFYVNAHLIESLNKKVEATPSVVISKKQASLGREKSKRVNRIKKANLQKESKRFTDEELIHFGWVGEKLFYNLLVSKNADIFELLGLQITDDITINWFNYGFESQENWTDKSIGKGYDMEILSGRRKLLVEIKSSRKNPGYFSMSGKELEIMSKKDKNYYIVKIDYMERVLTDGNVEIMIYKTPYSKFFKAEKIKAVTFWIEGNEDE